MALGVGVQDPMTSSCKQKMHKHIPIMSTSTKNATSKTYKFVLVPRYKIFRVFRGFEQLCSAMDWRVMNLA